MNTKKIRNITDSLETIKHAKFYNPNWAFVGFSTGRNAIFGETVIRTSPLDEYHASITKELNEAIEPVIKKYTKIYEEELRKCVSEQ